MEKSVNLKAYAQAHTYVPRVDPELTPLEHVAQFLDQHTGQAAEDARYAPLVQHHLDAGSFPWWIAGLDEAGQRQALRVAGQLGGVRNGPVGFPPPRTSPAPVSPGQLHQLRTYLERQ